MLVAVPVYPGVTDSDPLSSCGVRWGPCSSLTTGLLFLGSSFTHLKKRYGPDIAGAYFILHQGGSVKYERGMLGCATGKKGWGRAGFQEAHPVP